MSACIETYIDDALPFVDLYRIPAILHGCGLECTLLGTPAVSPNCRPGCRKR